MNTKKNQESITIYTYNEQGKATITLGKVEIIQAFCSNNSLNSDELMLRDETAKKVIKTSINIYIKAKT